MANQCANCNKRLRDGFVFVSPTDDAPHLSSDVHRKSRVLELAIEPVYTCVNNICGKCTADLVACVDDLIGETETCNADYIKFITDAHVVIPMVNTFKIEPHVFEEEVHQLKQTHEDQQCILNNLHYEDVKLKQEEDRCWMELLNLSKQFHQSIESDYFTNETNNTLNELVYLHNVNVYTDTFVIGVTSSGIGTINNLRLGKKSDEIVDWDEINAAWGQCVLLLSTLAKKLNFTFSKYRLIPMGAHASIQQKEQGGIVYPLHGSSTVMFNHAPHFYEIWGSGTGSSSFDNGLEAFLFCVSELCARVISLSPTISLPYYIDKDKIGTMQVLKSIKTSANTETDWSKALKYMLTNLKRILVHLPTKSSNI